MTYRRKKNLYVHHLEQYWAGFVCRIKMCVYYVYLYVCVCMSETKERECEGNWLYINEE